MKNFPRIDRVLVHACLLAAIVWAVSKLSAVSVDGQTILLFAGAIILMVVGMDMRVSDNRSYIITYRRSMHAAVSALLLVLVGPLITVVSGLVASVICDIRRRRPIYKMVGNLVTRVVPLLAAGLVWIATIGETAYNFTLPNDYFGLVTSLLTLALVHEIGYSIDSFADRNKDSTDNDHTIRDELRELPRNLSTCILQVFVGGGIGALCLDNPWAAPLVVPIATSAYLALERGRRIQEITELALDSFARIVDERDPYTFDHSDRVCGYAMLIGQELHLSAREMESLYWTSRLHDLGKVIIDNNILNKPGGLTDEEFEVMKRHSETSARILASFSFDEYDTEVVRFHHERYDGRGYLLKHRNDVPRESFIIGVADAFDAMTSTRPYRDAMPREVALKEIELGIGTQFHPEPALAFLHIMGYELSKDTQSKAVKIWHAKDEDLEELVTPHDLDLGDDFRTAA